MSKKSNKDSLGDRMKEYEACSKTKLMRRGYTMIRIDGKAFHTYTEHLKRPFDHGLIEDLDETAIYLCKHIQGAKAAFVQSDEISILITDFDKINTSAWFDNSVQKMCSIASSMATAQFNKLRYVRAINNQDKGANLAKVIMAMRMGEFDARVWQLPNKSEVLNYFIWRQQDTVRNSISTVAQSMFTHGTKNSQLYKKSCNDMQEMMFQKGTNWNDFDAKLKRGRLITKEVVVPKECQDILDQVEVLQARKVLEIKDQEYDKANDTYDEEITLANEYTLKMIEVPRRTFWDSNGPDTFTETNGRAYMERLIP